MAQENISAQLNDLLASRDFQPELLDKEGRPTDAENADIFTFDFVSSSGKNYGTMVIILDTDNEMQVFYGDNLGRSMEGDDKTEFFDFVQHLHKFANMRRWTYSPKNINQVKYTMQGLAAIKEGLFEGYYGTRKVSYSGEPTEARLVIQHNRTLGETDARFRYVESLFIETADSERYRLQFKNLAGGRAMLEHVRQGGKPYDVRGSHITEMVSEIATLSRFNRASAGRVLEGVTAELVTEAQQYYKSLRENLKRMAGTRGYQAYFESWHPAETTLQEELVDSIKTMFVEQTLDSRIEAALPVLARLQQENRMKEADIFESWADNLSEGTWALPDTPEKYRRLQDLMSRELIVGPDATNATEQLDDLVGDDRLFDYLEDLAARDASANVWDDTDVQARLGDLGIQLPNLPAVDDDNADATDSQQPVTEGRVKELEMDIADSLMSDEEFETKYGDSRGVMARELGLVRDRKTGKFYNPDQEFDRLTNSPEFGAQMRRMAQQDGVTEGVAETLSLDDALKVLRQYGAEHFKTGSESLNFYKNGRPFSVDLIWNDDATRSVSLSQLNSATRRLKGHGVAETTGDEKFDKSMRQMTGKITPDDAAEMFPTQEFEPYDLDPSRVPNEEKYKAKLFPLAYQYWTDGDNADELRALGWEPEYGDDYVMVVLYGIGHDGHIQYDKYDFDAEGADADDSLSEFAPPGSSDGGDDEFSEDTLKRLAAQWWNGDEDPGVEQTLMSAGWEIGQDEGYDNGGVFVVQAGDINGNSYISWPAEELEQGLVETTLKNKADLAESLLSEFEADLNYDELSEGANDKKSQPYHDPNWAKNLPKEKLDAIAGKKHKNPQLDVKEGSTCNHTMEGEMCPEHGLAECGMYESKETDSLLARLKSLAHGK